MSRSHALQRISAAQLDRELQGIWYYRSPREALRDEAPSAYKQIGKVMRAQKELTRVVRKLQPVLVQGWAVVGACSSSWSGYACGMTVDDIGAAALALPVEERAKLARALLESLDESRVDHEVEQAWIQEIDKRIRALDSGEATTVEWAEARERIARRLRERRAARNRG